MIAAELLVFRQFSTASPSAGMAFSQKHHIVYFWSFKRSSGCDIEALPAARAKESKPARCGPVDRAAKRVA